MYQGLTQYYLYNLIGIGIFLVFVIGGQYAYKRYQTQKNQKQADQQREEQQLIEQIQQEYEQLKKNIVQK